MTKSVWTMGCRQADVKARWHDGSYTRITKLTGRGAGDRAITGIAGHVSRRMLARHSHFRMGTRLQALENLAQRRKAVAGTSKLDESVATDERTDEVPPQ